MTEPKASTSKPTHPPTAKMVEMAILGMKDRKASSLQSIKKFIATNFEVDIDATYPRIKKYLKKATEEGVLVQASGSGATGSFKISKERKEAIQKEEKAYIKKQEKGTEQAKDAPKKKVIQKKKATEKKKTTEKKKETEKKKSMPKVKLAKG